MQHGWGGASTRIDCGVIKQGVIPKDEAEHERRLLRKVNVARKHEIVGNFAVLEERIVIEGDALHYMWPQQKLASRSYRAAAVTKKVEEGPREN